MTRIDSIHKATLSKDRCFLCGIKLDSNNRTVEHVIPRWIQRKFNLWDEKITLLNGSCINYRNLTIPCCKNCNNNHLNRKIETKVRRAVDEGINSLKALDKNLVFLWLNKISYALLYKELYLNRNQKSRSCRKIYTKKDMLKRNVQFIMTQAIRYPTEFIGSPFSLFIFELHSDFSVGFDYRDDINCSCVLLKLNNIGIIANISDNGLMYEFDKETKAIGRFQNEILHPIQFYELYAKLFAKSYTIKKVPLYTIFYSGSDNKEMHIICQPRRGNIFSDGFTDVYTYIFSVLIEKFGWHYDDIRKDNDRFITFVENEDGSFRSFDQLIEYTLTVP